MKTAAYVITLERAVNRRPQVDRIIANCPLPCHVVAAVDGSQLPPQQIDNVYKRYLHRPHYHLKLRLAEVGCFLSHRNVWERIVREGTDVALVLEDDVDLRMSDFPAALAFALADIQPGAYHQFQVRAMGAGHRVLRTDGNYSVLQPRIAPLRTSAQLVTRDAAAKLLQFTTRFDRPVDTTLQMTWLTRVPITVITPSCVTEVSQQIGGSTISGGKPFLTRLRHEFHRPLYRAQIAICARRYYAG